MDDPNISNREQADTKHVPLYDPEGQDINLPETERKARWQQKRGSFQTWATVLFTGIVAVAAIIQACYTKRYTDYARKQLKVINDGSEDTKKLLDLYRRQADATDRLARSAEDQAGSTRRNAESTSVVASASRKTAAAADASTRLARQSLIASNAPLVTVQDVQLLRSLKPDENLEISYTVINTGHGPALKLRIVFELDFPSARTIVGMPFDLRPSETNSELTLEAGSRSTNIAKWPVPLLRGDIAAIQSGKLLVRLKGIAIYDDIFGGHYRKEMCNEYDYDPSGKYLGLAYCSSHNGPPEHLKTRPW